MKTPRDKYYNDPAYRQVVDAMESIIQNAQLSPGEVREAAMLACIHYETRKPHSYIIPQSCVTAMERLKQYRETGQ